MKPTANSVNNGSEESALTNMNDAMAITTKGGKGYKITRHGRAVSGSFTRRIITAEAVKA